MDLLYAMRVYVKVVETGGFAKAALRLGVPNAAVTVRIQNLESHLKVKLLNRSTRKVSVTEEGLLYYEKCVDLLNSLDRLEEVFQTTKTLPSGTVQVDMPTIISHALISPILNEFNIRYPMVKLKINTKNHFSNLRDDGFDCVIRIAPENIELSNARKLCDMKAGLFASPRYIRNHGSPIHPNELKHHSCLNANTSKSNVSNTWTFFQSNNPFSVEPNTILEFDDIQSSIIASKFDAGICYCPVYAVKDEIRKGELVPIMTDWTLPDYKIYILFAKDKHLSARVKCFVDWIAISLTNRCELHKSAKDFMENK